MIASSLAVVGLADTRPDTSERLGRLFDAHHARLYRLARRMVSSSEEARDSVQETFLRAAKYSHSMPTGASSEEAWLVRILINICRDTWRKEAVRRRTPIEPSSQAYGTTEAALVARATIWRAPACSTAAGPRRTSARGIGWCRRGRVSTGCGALAGCRTVRCGRHRACPPAST